MSKIIVTGPESSGKTTLCKAISSYFKIPKNTEYAREFLENTAGEYKQEDLLFIAKEQLKSEKYCKILDTDLLTIKIWSNYKYGDYNDWIKKQIIKQKYQNRIYLLCKPDIPWEKDALREHPKEREKLFEIYKKELTDLQHKYIVVNKDKCISYYARFL